MKKVRIGVVGVGGISACHISAYQKNPDVELVAFCDINKDTLKKKGEMYGVKALYTDFGEMLKNEDIDAVSVCTWNNAHAELAIQALRAGKHVLCEKPMAMNREQAEKMLEESEKAGKILMVGFVRRYGNDVVVAKDLVDSGALGDIYFAKVKYLRRNGNPGGWFSDKKRSGGGPLIDLGVHVIDLARYLMGKPKVVSVYGATFEKLGNRSDVKDEKGYLATADGQKEVCDVEDLAVADLRFDNGSLMHLETSYSLNIKDDDNLVAVYGTKGGLDVNERCEIHTQQNGYLVDTSLANRVTMDSMFDNEINHFVDCVKNGKQPNSCAEDGLEIMKIIDAIYESSRTGHEVIIK